MTTEEFLAGFLGSSWIEIVASLAGFICVYLIIKRNIWCWPTGLLQVSLFMVVFYEVKLYSDLLLHGIYVVMQFYGWWYWLRGKDQENEVIVVNMPVSHSLIWVGVTVVGSVLLGFLMASNTDAALPYPDAFTTVASLTAQWLLSRRQLINWMFWIVVDIVAIGIYLQKGLYPTTLLYSVFLIMASTGLYSWWSRYKLQNSASGGMLSEAAS